MRRFYRAMKVTNYALFTSVMALTVLNSIAFVIPVNLLLLMGGEGINRNDTINYAPEVWLALLAFVFGTLIIVISIASESTPKLIDLFVKDYRSRFFIWIITLSILQNVFLQLIHSRHILFFDNLIFLNNYVLLPSFIILAIPYIFYILRYTKSSNVINKIYDQNRDAIILASQIENDRTKIEESHLALFETISQLHDLLQFVRFKEPKAEIIAKFGKSARFYLTMKYTLSDSYFVLGSVVMNDISFKTLVDKFGEIETKRTFYEKKVLRTLATSYVMLIHDGHFDLASLCGNELFEIGQTAANLKEEDTIQEVILHFNTQLRHGINHGLKTKEIRNVYNTIFHYSQLVSVFVKNRNEERILQVGGYFTFYGSEISKLSFSEPSFGFLINAFALQMKKMLIELYDNKFSRARQIVVIRMFNELCSRELMKPTNGIRTHDTGVRLIQIALCLFYMNREEREFNELSITGILTDLKRYGREQAKSIMASECDRIRNEQEEFWEETDQGNQNIFYSADKNQLAYFNSYVDLRIDESMFHVVTELNE